MRTKQDGLIVMKDVWHPILRVDNIFWIAVVKKWCLGKDVFRTKNSFGITMLITLSYKGKGLKIVWRRRSEFFCLKL